MSKAKIEQRRVTVRGREFHFVSYEGQPGNTTRMIEATGPSWFLMSAGKRWSVMPHDPGQPVDQTDQMLTQWLEANIFA